MAQISTWDELKAEAQSLYKILALEPETGERLGRMVIDTYNKLKASDSVKASTATIEKIIETLNERSEILYVGILIGLINSSDNKTLDIK